MILPSCLLFPFSCSRLVFLSLRPFNRKYSPKPVIDTMKYEIYPYMPYSNPVPHLGTPNIHFFFFFPIYKYIYIFTFDEMEITCVGDFSYPSYIQQTGGSSVVTMF